MHFLELANVFEIMEGTASRLRLTEQLADVYFHAKGPDVRHLTYLCQGILVPESLGIQLGVGDKLVQHAISRVSGKSIAQIEELYRKEGDLGIAAEKLLLAKSQSTLQHEDLTTRKVYDNFFKIATSSGSGSQDSKVNLIAELLTNASPMEAKHIVRFAQGSLRLGAGESTILDGLALSHIAYLVSKAKEIRNGGHIIKPKSIVPILTPSRTDRKAGEASSIDINFEGISEEIIIKKGDELSLGEGEGEIRGEVQRLMEEGSKRTITLQILEEKKKYRGIFERAYNMRSDLGEVAEKVHSKQLDELQKIGPAVFSPIRPALAERLLTPGQIIEKLGECSVEGKYDGFRLQIHKKGSEIRIFSRKEEPMTHMFPDIVSAIRTEVDAKNAIFEGEAIAYDAVQKRFLPFQVTIQRKRKHGVGEMARELPLRLYAFELLFADGRDYTKEPYEARRRKLESVIRKGASIVRISERIIAKSPIDLQAFFDKCLQEGLEGIIAKDQKAPYVAGARKFAWIKLKRSYGKVADTFDVVIIGYYLGKGKRAQFEFGGVLTAVFDPESGRYKSIAKVGTGFSEEQMGEFREMLEKITLREKPKTVDSVMAPDLWVEPKIVIEVNADEISRSPTHAAGRTAGSEEGFALRFPRMVSIRKDKRPQDATTESEILELYELQGQ
ncbi:MAG: ATP-dependent DNA ligase [Candidatus Micrarchaeota archaeon]